MADSNKAATPEPTRSPEDKAKLSKPVYRHIPKLSLTPSSLICLILSVLAIVLALSAIFQMKQLKEQKKAFLATINILGAAQQEQGLKLDNLHNGLNKAQSSLRESINAVNQHVQQSLEQVLYQKQDWMLLKARYFLELAQINAQWSPDQQTTIALLQEADNMLKAISNQNIYTIRQAIAQEITQIKTLPGIDFAGVLSQLDAAQSSVVQLPLKNTSFAEHPTKATSSSVKKESVSWKEKWQESVRLLEKVVVIRHYDSDIKAQIFPLHQTLARESIGINLQQAQWAVLHNNPIIYQQSLKRVLATIHSTFEMTAPATIAFIKHIESLQQINLSQTKPELEKSLSLLNQFIEGKNKTLSLPMDNKKEEH